jgi:hypothetical protein
MPFSIFFLENLFYLLIKVFGRENKQLWSLDMVSTLFFCEWHG